jgi:prophage regulatory protein
MLPMAEVIRLTSLSKSTIKRLVEAGLFPKPQRPSPRRIAWPASEVLAYRDRLAELRKQERRY